MPAQDNVESRKATASDAVGAMTRHGDVDVQLRESEELNRSLMDASPDCVKVLDLDGLVLHMNTPGLCAMEIDDFGSVCGQQWDALWPEGAQRDIERSVASALGGEASSFQAYCPTAKGTPKWWEVTVSPVRDSVGGSVVQLLSISRDITARKQAEDRLRASEAEFRAIFEQSPVGKAQSSAKTGRFVRVNAKYCELTGYSAEELMEMSPLDLHLADDRDADAKIVGQFFLGETPHYNAEKRYLRKDGKVIWVHINSTMMCNAEGHPERTMAVIQDITERKQADEKLRIAHGTFRHLVENSPFGIYTVDADFQLVQVSLGAQKVFENVYPLIGRDFAEVIRILWPEPFASEAIAIFRQVLETGEPYHAPGTVEVRADIAAVESYDWKVERIALPDGRLGAVCHFYDLSERQRFESLLNESEERYRAATAAVSDVIWTNNAQGFMQGEQPGWQAFTGQSPEEYQGYGWSSAIHPEDVQPTIDAWNRAVAGESRFEFQHRVRRHDGEWRFCSVRAVPILTADGTVREWVGVHSDITERKRDEEKVQQLAAELAEVSDRKDEFLATLAHELRNPLAPIRNGLQLMKLADQQTHVIEQARAMMDRQLTQMVRLVDDLMDVSRISQGKLELRMERVALASVLSSAVETSGPLIDKMGHELTVTLPNRPIMVHADPTRLAQVFMNLLNNGAKYSDHGGRIHLHVELQGSAAVVTVKDTGIGIAADQLAHIFGMFTQVDQSLERSQGGLGIGLTLVKRLVEMHGGTVEAKSAGPGKGSEFIVRLPALADASQPEASCIGDEPAATMPSLRILVVDDNRDGADSLSELLKLMGNDTRTAYDGQQGLDMAEAFLPDVILLDIGLPKLNGYEACRLIREKPWGKATVLVAVTGWGQNKDRQRTREAGFDHHLVKPIDTQDLMKMLTGLPVGPNTR